MTWLVSRAELVAAAEELNGYGQTARLHAPNLSGLNVGDLNQALPPGVPPLGLRRWHAAVGVPIDSPAPTSTENAAAADAADQPRAVVATIEHFAQLERLANAAPPDVRTGLGIRVEVAFGHKSFGTRPGRETSNVVEAVLRAGYDWHGLSVAVRSPGMAEAAAGSLDDCRDLAERPVTISYTAAEPELRPLLPPGSECVLSPPVIGLRANVVGRPSLERAVLDVGTRCGLRAKQSIEATTEEQVDTADAAPLGSLKVVAVEPDRALVEWTEPLHDFLIGSGVTLRLHEATGCGDWTFPTS